MHHKKAEMLARKREEVEEMQARIKKVWPMLVRARKVWKRYDTEYGQLYCDIKDTQRWIHEETKGITRVPSYDPKPSQPRKSKPKILTEEEVLAVTANLGQDMIMALMQKLGEDLK